MLPPGTTIYINVSVEFVIVRKHMLLLRNNTNRIHLIQQELHTEKRNCVHSAAMEMGKNVSRYTTAIPMRDTGCDFPGS
jgi:hypothetical protein